MKKGSRKVQFEIRETHIVPDAAGGWAMRVVLEGHLDGLSGVQEALEEAEAQAPSMLIEVHWRNDTKTLDPPLTDTVPEDTSDNMLDLPFAPAAQPRPDIKDINKRIGRKA